MADSKAKAGLNPKPRRSFLKFFFRAGILLCLLVVVAYFIVTSSAFIQGVVIPRVEKTIHAKIAIADVDFSPFSKLALNEVKITPDGRDTLLSAKLIRVRYSLISILRGDILVEEIALDTPILTIVTNPDGSSNLDNFKSLSSGVDHSETGTHKSLNNTAGATKLNIKSIAIKNATFRQSTTDKSGDKVSSEIANFNLTASDIRNGAGGKLDFSGGMSLDKTTASPPSLASIQAMLGGSFTFNLTETLTPSKTGGAATFTIGRGTGEFADINGLVAKLDCEVSPTEVKQLALRFDRGVKHLGEVRMSGPLDAVKQEGKLKIEILSIDRQVLNLFGAASGIDFAGTSVSANCDVELSKGGKAVASNGRVEVARFQIKRQGQTTPALDMRCDYGIAMDKTARTLEINNINLAVAQKAHALLQGELSNPMMLALGDNVVSNSEAALILTLTDLNLADWKTFTGQDGPNGMASAKIKLISQPGGNSLTAQIESLVENLSLGSGEKVFRVGELSFNGAFTNQSGGHAFNGELAAHNISIPSAPGAQLEAALKLDASVVKNIAELRKCALRLTPTERATNELTLTGSLDFSDTKAVTGKLVFFADALDATHYYDLFDSKTKPDGGATKPTGNTNSVASNKEPDPVKLPVRNFTIEANIGHFYLREVDAANFKTTLVLDGSHVVLKPFQLTLNDAPITATADVDMSAPGYKYDLAVNANGVPIEPLANTFSPAYKGKAKGTLIADIKVKGAGVTGVNLKKTLTATADLNFTNANIQIVGKSTKKIVGVIAAVLNASELLNSPLDFVTTSIRAADGKIEMPTFIAQSAVLHAETKGTVTIADVLADSPLNQPVEVSLVRNLANKLSFSNVPTNVPYMKLPEFVTIKGTLGNVEPKTDKSKLAGLGIMAVGAGVANLIGGKGGDTVGNAVNMIGGLLGAKPAATGTNAPPPQVGTNSTTTNQTKPANLLDLFKKPKK